MATTIFEKQILSGFAYHSVYGAYVYPMNPAPFELILGEKYVVYWDGDTYTCEAHDASAIGGYIVLGNAASIGLAGNDEPFAIGWAPLGVTFMAVNDKIEHEIGISEYEESNAPYLLKVSKEDKEFSGFKKLALERADGTVGYFTPGEPSSKTVALDFSNGDMTVVPDKDKFLTEVSILKPSTLTPENIAKGVQIAGIEGTYSASGGGEGEVESKAINFYDPMGNIIYSYTRAEAAALTELPPGPELEGFTFDKWNYTLSQIKAVKYFADVGPSYKRNGTCAAVLIVDIPAHDLSVTVNTKCYTGNSGTIDWMDGSSVTAIAAAGSGTYCYSYKHTYVEPGIKCIAVMGAYGLGAAVASNDLRESAIGANKQSATQITPESSLLSILEPSDSSGILKRAEGHMRLKFISGTTDWTKEYGCQACYAPSLEVTSFGPSYFDANTYEYFVYAPKLRRLSISFSTSSYKANIKGEVCRYLDSLTDLCLNTNILPSVMNVNRRVIIEFTNVPTVTLADIQWGSGDIYVPDESVEAYKASELFAPVVDCIKPISEYPDY